MRAMALALMAAMPARADEDPALAALLAAPADVAYGAHLAGECTSCHQPGVANAGVPWITGHEPEWFARAMHEYRVRTRAHPIMNMVAAGLGDEEIASLAAYFATIE